MELIMEAPRPSLWRRSRVPIALLVAAAIMLVWYVGSPRWTLHQMKEAAIGGDADKLAGYIDFPAVRASLKENLKAKMAAEVTKGGDGFGALGAMMGMAMIDPMIDGLVTPAGMRAMFMKNKADAPKGIQKVDASSDKMEFVRTGFSQFMLHNPAEPAGTGLIFKRYGLSWKLAELRMPD